jgi:hypothetical protein
MVTIVKPGDNGVRSFYGETAMGVDAAVAKKKTGPKPTPEGPRNVLFAMKCRQDYKDWLITMAREERITPSQLVDRALFEYAKKNGKKEPPAR